jgi:predicted transcriptional regulator of viral defense system
VTPILAESGRNHFTTDEAQQALGRSLPAVRGGLRRLIERGQLATPAQGFYVIVPPEYRRLGCLPAEQFVPQLMAATGTLYYSGLLSAAQYHGAAHHRPQQFQVMLESSRRLIHCGSVVVKFIVRANLKKVPTKKINTPQGFLEVSTVEATAVDLVGYPKYVGGLDGAATVLSELGEQIDPTQLVTAAATAPLSWAQRLGFLLELLGYEQRAARLAEYVRERAIEDVALATGMPVEGDARSARWRLRLNAEIEVDT